MDPAMVTGRGETPHQMTPVQWFILRMFLLVSTPWCRPGRGGTVRGQLDTRGQPWTTDSEHSVVTISGKQY